ncbi:unnamed protein product [Blepharisma stoltei]|uniref:Cyclic nucleotide-binding domain-containing protein n=1 Tax=Blepharisma stoltei TaxID=1481888 RepID=A0AAU9INQ0_9CILI|nr:unnamed protein product [Blepharisma stoltei]
MHYSPVENFRNTSMSIQPQSPEVNSTFLSSLTNPSSPAARNYWTVPCTPKLPLLACSNHELKEKIKAFRKDKKSPNKSKIHKSELFPEWLLDRKDFQDTIRSYDDIKNLDVCLIAEKTADERSAVERNALESFCKKYWFFNGLGKSTRLHICDRLRSEYYEPSENIVVQGQLAEKLYFIVKGTVIITKEDTKSVLGPFNNLGEKELISSKEYTYSVSANDSKVFLFVLNKHDYDLLVFKPRLKVLYLEKDQIRQIPLFSKWRVSKLEIFCNSLQCQQFSLNEVIYTYNSPATHFYIIMKGEVSLEMLITIKKVNSIPTGDSLKETLITEEKYIKKVKNFKTGEIFGEREVIIGASREAKAISKSEKLILYIISKQDFFEIFTKQERDAILAQSDATLTTPAIAKKLKYQIDSDHKRFTALLEASEIRRIKSGRGLFDDSITERHNKYAKSLISQHRKNINKLLIGKNFKIAHSRRKVF